VREVGQKGGEDNVKGGRCRLKAAAFTNGNQIRRGQECRARVSPGRVRLWPGAAWGNVGGEVYLGAAASLRAIGLGQQCACARARLTGPYTKLLL
jgi:hypothetical protein